MLSINLENPHNIFNNELITKEDPMLIILTETNGVVYLPITTMVMIVAELKYLQDKFKREDR